MSGQFQYFVVPKVAGKPTIALDECAEYGLGHAFNSTHPPKCCKSSEGPRPDRSGGIILSSTTDRIGYYPNRQKWRAMHGNPDVWIGMETEHVPTPSDLAHEKQADGEWLTLADGNRWLIPRARQWEEHEQLVLPREVLPAPLDVNEFGHLVRGEIDKHYRELWTLANEYYEAERDAEGETFKFDMTRLVSVALQANYRASVSEWILMGVLYPEVPQQVAAIITDSARLVEFLKKNLTSDRSQQADDSSRSSSGAEPSTKDNAPDTDQPSPISKRGPGEFTETTTLSMEVAR